MTPARSRCSSRRPAMLCVLGVCAGAEKAVTRKPLFSKLSTLGNFGDDEMGRMSMHPRGHRALCHCPVCSPYFNHNFGHSRHQTKEKCRVCFAPLSRNRSNKRKNPLCHHHSGQVTMFMYRRHVDFEAAILIARRQFLRERWQSRIEFAEAKMA